MESTGAAEDISIYEKLSQIREAGKQAVEA